MDICRSGKTDCTARTERCGRAVLPHRKLRCRLGSVRTLPACVWVALATRIHRDAGVCPAASGRRSGNSNHLEDMRIMSTGRGRTRGSGLRDRHAAPVHRVSAFDAGYLTLLLPLRERLSLAFRDPRFIGACRAFVPPRAALRRGNNSRLGGSTQNSLGALGAPISFLASGSPHSSVDILSDRSDATFVQRHVSIIRLRTVPHSSRAFEI